MPSKKWGLCERCGREGRLKARNMHSHCYDLWRQEQEEAKKAPKAKGTGMAQPAEMNPVELAPLAAVCHGGTCAIDPCPAVTVPAEPVGTGGPVVVEQLPAFEPPPKSQQPRAKSPPARPAKPKRVTFDCRVTVDFGPAVYLLEEIKRQAESELRSVGCQVLWNLKQAMDAAIMKGAA
jgi:hypothetical protein